MCVEVKYTHHHCAPLSLTCLHEVMPIDPAKRAPSHALRRVDEELRHRELKIQGELITLRPLVS